MTYVRVIPRDLFNEASLLKCLGRIYLNLENLPACNAELIHDDDGPFIIRQDDSTGGIFCSNVRLVVRGSPVYLDRPLNSRDPWPLYATTQDDDVYSVFNDDGSFHAEFLEFIA